MYASSRDAALSSTPTAFTASAASNPSASDTQPAALSWPEDMSPADIALAQARRMLQFVSVSRALFPDLRDLADHPGWEIMLQLYIAGREGRVVVTHDLCEITGCWPPLTNRYIELLFQRGIVDREVTPDQPENWPLRLTQQAEDRFFELLHGFARGWAGTATPAG